MAQSFSAVATASAIDGSSDSPRMMVRRSASYTFFGSRFCCAASLKTRLPNVPLPFDAPVSLPRFSDQSRMAPIASPNTAEPMCRSSYVVSGVAGPCAFKSSGWSCILAADTNAKPSRYQDQRQRASMRRASAILDLSAEENPPKSTRNSRSLDRRKIRRLGRRRLIQGNRNVRLTT